MGLHKVRISQQIWRKNSAVSGKVERNEKNNFTHFFSILSWINKSWKICKIQVCISARHHNNDTQNKYKKIQYSGKQHTACRHYFKHNDTQHKHNDAQHNDIQYNNEWIATLSIMTVLLWWVSYMLSHISPLCWVSHKLIMLSVT